MTIDERVAALERRVGILEGVKPNPVNPPIVVSPPAIPIRRSVGVEKLRVGVMRSPAQRACRVVALWTTLFGSWEVGSHDSIYSIPQWAKDEYIHLFPMSGGDHNIYAVLLDTNGYKMHNGVRLLVANGSSGYSVEPKNDGYLEMDIFGYFNPDDPRQSGGWDFRFDVAGIDSDVVTGFGLPMNQHVSLFSVWELA